MRVVNGVPPTGDYSFAKFNKVYQGFFLFLKVLLFLVLNLLSVWWMQSVDVLEYTNDEYEKFLSDPVSIQIGCVIFVEDTI